jgi:hypothetical protein
MTVIVSVVKGMIIILARPTISRISWGAMGPDIVLIVMGRMWKAPIAVIIIVRSFAVVVSVHNGVTAAVSAMARIIRIMGASAGQQRKSGEQHSFSD